MKERGRSGGNGRMGRRRFSNMGACVCPKCGYRQNHVQGSPCRMISCPSCGSAMMNEAVRGQMSGTQVSQEKRPKVDILDGAAEKPNSEVQFPHVDASLCKGCGVCVDVCPQNAIVLQDGIACISVDVCRNCRLCVRKCPSGAIS